MCQGGPSSVGKRGSWPDASALTITEALGLLDRALIFLNDTDFAGLPTAVQAESLRALERVAAKHTAARARALAAFIAQHGCEDDGHGTTRGWLAWQTRVTRAAAAGAVGWARRLSAHPVIGEALAAGDLSESWARRLCEWSDRLPEQARPDADEILACAARAGVDLPGLAGLASEMLERSRTGDGGDGPPPDGFDDRGVWLGTTLGGAGRLEGDLAPGCSAALSAVLEALGKKAGPEDTRTVGQRRHDALEEACRRLIASGMLPGRAGQPTHVQLHMTLSQLRGLPHASQAEAAWAAARAGEPGWLSGPEADAAACDATVLPIVTGRLDKAALDRLTAVILARLGAHAALALGDPPQAAPGQPRPGLGTDQSVPGRPPAAAPALELEQAPPGTVLSPAARLRLQRSLLSLATDVLSGPGGLAAALRAGLGGPASTTSLPLDTGAATEIIPAHLRRAATLRHPRCAFPGCAQPASVCEIHHLIPRARGGPTALWNLVPLCRFHHLIVIHRWGWTLRLHPDGTTTATSPDGSRVRHSHGPPQRAA